MTATGSYETTGTSDTAETSKTDEVKSTAQDKAAEVKATAQDKAAEVKEAAADVKDKAAGAAQTAAQAGTEVASHAADQAKQVAAEAQRQARNLMGEASSQVQDQARTQQQRASDSLRQLAEQLRSMANNSDQQGLATELAHQGADHAHTLADFIGNRNPGELLDELRNYARRRPGAFILSALAAGVVAGRLTRGAVSAAQSSDDSSDAALPVPQSQSYVSPSYGTTGYSSYETAGYSMPPTSVPTSYEPAPYEELSGAQTTIPREPVGGLTPSVTTGEIDYLPSYEAPGAEPGSPR